MSLKTLAAALRGLAPKYAMASPVKLFGGEPLVRPGLVKRAILLGAELGLSGGFELATNGVLLDRRMFRFLSAHPEVEVVFSRLSSWAGRLPNISMNFVILPGEKAVAVLGRMKKAITQGFRRFNFLPAYFTPWETGDLAELSRSLSGIRKFLKGLSARGVSITVKNLERFSCLPLYNDGPCVDTDGGIYASNLILARGMAPFAERLRLGDIRRPGRLSRPLSGDAMREILRCCFEPEALRGTGLADSELTEFVHGFS